MVKQLAMQTCANEYSFMLSYNHFWRQPICAVYPQGMYPRSAASGFIAWYCQLAQLGDRDARETSVSRDLLRLRLDLKAKTHAELWIQISL